MEDRNIITTDDNPWTHGFMCGTMLGIILAIASALMGVLAAKAW